MKWFVFPWICLFCSIAQTQLSSTGVIAGTVTGEDGSAIAGARVGLVLQSAQPHGKGAQTFWGVTSAADGSFSLSSLNGGTYKVCADVPNTAWLNPCDWGLSTPTASLSANVPSASAAIVLKKGAIVPMRIDDPNHVLVQNEGKTPGANLLIGAGTAISSFHSASIASQDATGRNYQLVIPYGYASILVVRSLFFKLTDANGVSLLSGTTIAITVASGQTPAMIHLIVTGGGQ